MKSLTCASIPCLVLALGLIAPLAAQDSPPNPAAGASGQSAAANQQQRQTDVNQDEIKKSADKTEAEKFSEAFGNYAAWAYLNRALKPQQANSGDADAARAMAGAYYSALQQMGLANGDQGNSAQQGYAEAIVRYYEQQAQQGADAASNQNSATMLQRYHQSGLAAPNTANLYREYLRYNQAQISPYWLGLQTGKLADNVRPFLDLPEDQGVVVLAVVDDSPAKEAGVEVNDIVISLANKPVGKISDVYDIVGETKDSQTQIVVIRRGKKLTLDITPRKRPETDEGAGSKSPNGILYLPKANVYVPQPPIAYYPLTAKSSAYGPYVPQTSSDQSAKIKELESQIKDLKQRLEKLEKQSKQ